MSYTLRVSQIHVTIFLSNVKLFSDLYYYSPIILWYSVFIHFGILIVVCNVLSRDRSKMFQESITKVDGYINSKKRQRNDLSSERGSGVMLTKMGSQIHKIPNDNMTPREVKTPKSMLNKRIRTSVADMRVYFKLLLLRF